MLPRYEKADRVPCANVMEMVVCAKEQELAHLMVQHSMSEEEAWIRIGAEPAHSE
jgi:hypothetical protein